MGVTKRIDTARGGHSYKLDGQKVDGVTTIIGNGIPKPALINWASKMAATFAADNLETLNALDRESIIELVKGSPWRERDAAARRGTEVHTLAEHLISDLEVTVPDELLGHVDSYLKFLGDFDVQQILTEAVVGHRAHRWMGTLDLIAQLKGGDIWLLDIKTTRSGIFGETALQLAAYRHAEFYLDSDGNEQPMLPVDKVGAIWVRADGYDVVPVDASDNTYRTFRYAQQIAQWQTVTSKTAIGDVIQPPKGNAA
jgi:hypothetical protein